VDPAPPQITIVNPNAPEGAQEVLGSDGGWRPSAYQSFVALLTALIVALVVVGVQRVRHVHHEAALDAAARDGVELEVVPDDESDSDEGFKLLSTSTGTVTVLSVGFVGDGYREQRQHVTISPQSFGSVEPSSEKNCTTSLFATGPTEVRVTVRTSRGDVVTRTLPLTGTVTQQVQSAERWRCGYLLPTEAVYAHVVSARRDGRDVLADFSVIGSGRFPVTILSITPPDGLAATAAGLPVTLGRPAFWTGHSKPVRVTVRMRVTDCEAFAAGFFRYDGESGMPQGLQVLVKHDYGSGVTTWPFAVGGFELDDDSGFDGTFGPSRALTLLESGCDPDLFPTQAPVVQY
jgi:hypothetical protein